MADGTKWACPKCGAKANAHGKGGIDACKDRYASPSECNGFLCECDVETEETHGETYADPCPYARCHHCGWEGKFPRPPRSMKPWEKTALAAGWTPPVGWEEAVKDSGRLTGKE